MISFRSTASCLRSAALAGAIAIAGLSGGAHAQTQADAEARFRVTMEPLPHAPADGPAPMTATIGQLSEASVSLSPAGGEAEPTHLRTWFEVRGGSPTGLTAGRDALTFGGKFASRLFDGAEVEVLRLRDGRFEHVRTARIAAGGHQPDPWDFFLWQPHQLISPEVQTFSSRIPNGWREGATVHVGLIAVDRLGRASGVGISNPITTNAVEARTRTDSRTPYVWFHRYEGSTAGRSLLVETPDNVRAEISEGALHVSWDRPSLITGLGLKGYALVFTFGEPGPIRPSQLVFDSAGPAPQRGDLAILRAEVTEFARDRAQTPGHWTRRPPNSPWRGRLLGGLTEDAETRRMTLEPHDADTPVFMPGTHFLRARPTAGAPVILSDYMMGAALSFWRHPVKADVTFELSFWARAPQGGDMRAVVKLFPYLRPVEAETGLQLGDQPFDLSPDWERHTLRFRATVLDDPRAAKIDIALEGDGVVDIDNIFLAEAEAGPGQATPLMVEKLSADEIGFLRTHSTIKTGVHTYSMKRAAGGVRDGLHPLLRFAEAAGTRPWLQIEPHLSAAEWQGLVEYLAAPWDPQTDSAATKPYAALRAAQGRAAPWTDSFDRLRLELGNEMWNRLFAPWVALPLTDAGTGERVSDAQMLGAYHAYALEAMSRSPYWDALSGKLETVIGGWAINPSFGVQAARFAARAGQPVDHVGIGAYIGGWDEGERVVTETPAGYMSLLSHAEQVSAPRVAEHRAALEALSREGLPVPDLITYEGGPGYQLDGLNGARVTEEQAARQERVMKSHAGGTATLDAFLSLASQGVDELNFFNFRHGDLWSSHAPIARGGHPYPAWEWTTLIGREIAGRMLQVETLAVPRADFPSLDRREAMADAPLIALYALRSENRLTLVATSRMVPGAPGVTGAGTSRITVALPVESASGLRRWSMTGAFDTNDVEDDLARLEQETLSTPDTPGEIALDLPAGSAQVLVLEDVVWK